MTADLEALARQAGAGIGTSGRWLFHPDQLARFAQLVREEALREAAVICDETHPSDWAFIGSRLRTLAAGETQEKRE